MYKTKSKESLKSSVKNHFRLNGIEGGKKFSLSFLRLSWSKYTLTHAQIVLYKSLQNNTSFAIATLIPYRNDVGLNKISKNARLEKICHNCEYFGMK